jgi:hypothetical protein
VDSDAHAGTDDDIGVYISPCRCKRGFGLESSLTIMQREVRKSSEKITQGYNQGEYDVVVHCCGGRPFPEDGKCWCTRLW